jgi:integrase
MASLVDNATLTSPKFYHPREASDRVDLDRRRLNISISVTEVRGQLVWGSPKNHDRRSVPAPSLVLAGLSERAVVSPGPATLFRGADGGVVRAGNFRNRVFNKAVAKCMTADPTFSRITTHDLRHTAAPLAVAAGASVKAVQRMLGHASAAMTLDVYADLFDDDLDAVVDALDR